MHPDLLELFWVFLKEIGQSFIIIGPVAFLMLVAYFSYKNFRLSKIHQPVFVLEGEKKASPWHNGKGSGYSTNGHTKDCWRFQLYNKGSRIIRFTIKCPGFKVLVPTDELSFETNEYHDIEIDPGIIEIPNDKLDICYLVKVDYLDGANLPAKQWLILGSGVKQNFTWFLKLLYRPLETT